MNSRDIDGLTIKNDPNKSEELNKFLSKINVKLEEKGIKLIVMVYPDKFNLYKDYLENKSTYEKPLLLHNFNALAKDYEYINVYDILKEAIDAGEKDIYLYDDTHTSQKATELLLKEFMNK